MTLLDIGHHYVLWYLIININLVGIENCIMISHFIKQNNNFVTVYLIIDFTLICNTYDVT